MKAYYVTFLGRVSSSEMVQARNKNEAIGLAYKLRDESDMECKCAYNINWYNDEDETDVEEL